MEVDLHTDALGSVRLHGVVTDFADFYASGGVGPYDGQVYTRRPLCVFVSDTPQSITELLIAVSGTQGLFI